MAQREHTASRSRRSPSPATLPRVSRRAAESATAAAAAAALVAAASVAEAARPAPAPAPAAPSSFFSYVPAEVLGAALQVCGSVCAKLGLGDESAHSPAGLARAACAHVAGPSGGGASGAACVAAALAARGLSLAAMAALNAGGMLLFFKGMRAGGSMRATVRATAANTLLSAVAGAALFDETLSLRWAAGAALICAGVALLAPEDGADAGGEAGSSPAAAGASPPPHKTRGGPATMRRAA